MNSGNTLLADPAAKGLRLLFALFALAFDAMAEDLVEDDARSARRKHRRAKVGVLHRRVLERHELLDDLLDFGQHGGIVGKAVRARREEELAAGKFHAVTRLCEGAYAEAISVLDGLDSGAVARDKPARLSLGGKGSVGKIDVAVALERLGVTTNFLLPKFAIYLQGRARKGVGVGLRIGTGPSPPSLIELGEVMSANKPTGAKKKSVPKKVDWKALEVVHPDAAGIDVGGSEHWVAVSPDRDPGFHCEIRIDHA
jgi:hypothetical protein